MYPRFLQLILNDTFPGQLTPSTRLLSLTPLVGRLFSDNLYSLAFFWGMNRPVFKIMTERPMNPTFIDDPNEPLPEEVWDFDSYEFAESRDIMFVPEPTEEQKQAAKKKPKSKKGEESGNESEQPIKKRRRRADVESERSEAEEEADIYEGRQHPSRGLHKRTATQRRTPMTTSKPSGESVRSEHQERPIPEPHPSQTTTRPREHSGKDSS